MKNTLTGVVRKGVPVEDFYYNVKGVECKFPVLKELYFFDDKRISIGYLGKNVDIPIKTYGVLKIRGDKTKDDSIVVHSTGKLAECCSRTNQSFLIDGTRFPTKSGELLVFHETEDLYSIFLSQDTTHSVLGTEVVLQGNRRIYFHKNRLLESAELTTQTTFTVTKTIAGREYSEEVVISPHRSFYIDPYGMISQ